MSKPRKKTPVKRYGLCVPLDDAVVIDWLYNQHNMSMSIRHAIREYANNHGIADAFCSNDGAPQMPSKTVEPQTAPYVAPIVEPEPPAPAQVYTPQQAMPTQQYVEQTQQYPTPQPQPHEASHTAQDRLAMLGNAVNFG